MTLTKMIVMVAAIGIGATTFLTTLAAAGLGDFSGETGPGASAGPTQADASTPSAPAKPGGLTITAKDISYDKTNLSAPAGEVTITFDNQDPTPHNLDILSGPNPGGESLGKTQIKTGPATSTLSVTLQPGKYYYQCDVHPGQMHGILTVT